MHCVLGCKVILSDYKDSGVIVRPSPQKRLSAVLRAVFVEMHRCFAAVPFYA